MIREFEKPQASGDKDVRLGVLGIMGSPRIKGNADLLLDEALKGA